MLILSQVHLHAGFKQVIRSWKGMRFVTNSFITIFQTIVFNSGLYYFPNICAHLHWENDESENPEYTHNKKGSNQIRRCDISFRGA